MAKIKSNNLITQQYNLRIPLNLYKSVRLKLIKENKKLHPLLIEMLQQFIKK